MKYTDCEYPNRKVYTFDNIPIGSFFYFGETRYQKIMIPNGDKLALNVQTGVATNGIFPTIEVSDH